MTTVELAGRAGAGVNPYNFYLSSDERDTVVSELGHRLRALEARHAECEEMDLEDEASALSHRIRAVEDLLGRLA